MNAAAIRVLYDYNAWAHAQVWQAMKSLDEEQFTQSFDYSLGSLRDHLVHVASVDARWWARVRGADKLPLRLNPADFPTREDVSRLWSVVYHDISMVLEHMDDDFVTEDITYTARGEERTNPAWQILLHVVNHGTDHRAQMLYLLHQLGVKTTEQDFVYYLRDEMPPRGQVTVNGDMIRALFSYDTYATSRLVSECMAALDDDALDQDFGYSHGTVRRQLAHVIIAGQYWLGRAFDTDIESSVSSVFAAMTELGNNVTDKELTLPVEYTTSHGRPAANIRWEMLWHLVNHNTDHRAQTLAMLHELGAPTFEQDLMIYFWDYHDTL